ncbi:MAG: DUF3253 domain-containing protein [Verrucomicrobiota bacterium]
MSSRREELQDAIRVLLDQRSEGKTVCPSEAARKVFPDNWREHMEETREVGIELARKGEIEICQGGEPVQDFQFRGPIRFRKIQ